MPEIEAVIRERITEVEAERKRLEAALAALRGRTQAGNRARSRRSTRRARGGGAAKRAKPGERRDQILRHLKDNSGARPSEIAKSISASSQQVSAVIRRLHSDKLVRRRGNGHGLSKAGESAAGGAWPLTPSSARA